MFSSTTKMLLVHQICGFQLGMRLFAGAPFSRSFAERECIRSPGLVPCKPLGSSTSLSRDKWQISFVGPK